MKRFAIALLLILMISSVLFGRYETQHLTEMEAFTEGWLYWLSAIIGGAGVLWLAD